MYFLIKLFLNVLFPILKYFFSKIHGPMIYYKYIQMQLIFVYFPKILPQFTYLQDIFNVNCYYIYDSYVMCKKDMFVFLLIYMF